MRVLIASLVLIFAAVAVAQDSPLRRPRCVPNAEGTECSPIYAVSIVELIARPERFDAKRVRAIGYVHFGFEGNGIYLHREDYEHDLYANGLWVTLGAGVAPTNCQDRYVVVDGTFRAGMRGHMGLWSGAIVDITRCTPY